MSILRRIARRLRTLLTLAATVDELLTRVEELEARPRKGERGGRGGEGVRPEAPCVDCGPEVWPDDAGDQRPADRRPTVAPAARAELWRAARERGLGPRRRGT